MSKRMLSNQPLSIQPSSDQPSPAQLSEPKKKAKLEKSNARVKRSRELKKENEMNGELLSNTTPLLVCGKTKVTSLNNEERENFMTVCKDIISERVKKNKGMRNCITTYPGSKNPCDKNILPTHLYHRIHFFCGDTKTIYSEEKAVTEIRSLADGENFIDLSSCHKYEDAAFLSSICSILCATISSKRNFKGILDSKYGK